ncbi:MAG: endopeptidase La [Anaerolineales bacterium]
MRAAQTQWSNFGTDLGQALNRRSEELYEVEDALLDDHGLIHCVILPLRDIVLYPNMVTPLFVSHEPTLSAIEEANRRGETVIAVAQHDPMLEDPAPEDLYRVATEVAITRPMQLPDSTISILTQGRRRVEIVDFDFSDSFLRASARPIHEKITHSKEAVALMRAVLTLFEQVVRLNRSIPEEAYVYAVNIEEPGWLADLVASALTLTIGERQQVLETFDPVERLQYLSVLLGRELDVLELEDQIHAQVQNEVDRSQREMYLREQMKAIQTELGEGDIWSQELADLRQRIEEKHLPESVAEPALKEVQRLQQLPPVSPEVGIIKTYLDWLLELPWTETTEDNLDVRNAAKVLDDGHYGLKEPKERILEYIAVRSLAPEQHKQPILCFVGPPGTGKTSLGRSIAEALGRKFLRISLGGVRDEAEIRGHRRTYVGALPGRIIQGMRRAGTINPLFMLDEIDKLGADFRGDPSSALLEVLDPEQNFEFSDHYLEMAYDLSSVLFITTANTTDTIPPALLDRMEVIDFSGYIEEEKLIIAHQFLIPRQAEQNGLGESPPEITEQTLKTIIREYTWEAGVRNLEREIGKVFRKMARKTAEKRKVPPRITPAQLGKLLGPPQLNPRELDKEDQVGTAISLAWTENGGDTLPVEVLLVDGKGNLQITGQLGDVMQESAQAALTYIRSRASDWGIEPELFENKDIHIHVPEGAIPKDGPSAGITIATSLASALTGWPVRRDVGMTGEITLRGRVLPIGGLREKVLAAYRLKMHTVILPKQNKKDLVDLPKEARESLKMRYVEHMDEVLEFALRKDKAIASQTKKKRSAKPKSKRGGTSKSARGRRSV